MDMKKIFYIIGGCISLGLGTLGAVLPLLPVVPFLLLDLICFARSSRRLHSWFLGTRLYKKNLETYVAGKGMTRQTKIRIMVTVTLLMAVGFAMMYQVAVGTYYSHWCLGIPCSLLPVWSENHSCTKIRLFKSITVI